jgi:vacuolar-type H+-ATPase subunit C/Vma6
MELLLDPEDRGYPAEYLLSRIRGRRARLITDWRPLIFDASPFDSLSPRGTAKDRSPEGVWRNLTREYRWVYLQMNKGLRLIFRPFFLYVELRTLFICLRHGNVKKAGAVEELLAASLLSDDIRHILVTSPDVRTAVSGIERVFLPLSVKFSGLSRAFDVSGLTGVEQRLMTTYLAVTVQAGLHPVMERFFKRLIDARNIMNLYKYFRLELTAAPPFIEGGDVPKERVKELIGRHDAAAVTSLVRERTGIKLETPDPTEVESALYKGMTRHLRKEGRDHLGTGLILDYLWRCSIEARNLSVLLSSRDLEREVVSAELVQ